MPPPAWFIACHTPLYWKMPLASFRFRGLSKVLPFLSVTVVTLFTMWKIGHGWSDAGWHGSGVVCPADAAPIDEESTTSVDRLAITWNLTAASRGHIAKFSSQNRCAGPAGARIGPAR